MELYCETKLPTYFDGDGNKIKKKKSFKYLNDCCIEITEKLHNKYGQIHDGCEKTFQLSIPIILDSNSRINNILYREQYGDAFYTFVIPNTSEYLLVAGNYNKGCGYKFDRIMWRHNNWHDYMA